MPVWLAAQSRQKGAQNFFHAANLQEASPMSFLASLRGRSRTSLTSRSVSYEAMCLTWATTNGGSLIWAGFMSLAHVLAAQQLGAGGLSNVVGTAEAGST
jgi:hypothetical protein